jgi:glutamate carboxypeptidase
VDAATRQALDAVASRDGVMRLTLKTWSETNSGSTNLPGVRRQRQLLQDVLSPMADRTDVIKLPPREVVDDRGDVQQHEVAEAVVFRKRPDTPRKVLLNGHLDTVFAADSPFQKVTEQDHRWIGPGVADLKGGLVVLSEAVCAFEEHPLATSLGWTIVLNPDEELGSPASTSLLQAEAKGHVAGLVFEPALEDGQLAGARGGNGNFDLVIRGRSAHVGREFAQGRSAIHVAGEVVALLANLNQAQGVTVNVGRIDGGGPVNQVADLAIIRFNVRVADAGKQEAIGNDLRRLTMVLGRRDGITATLHGDLLSPPKPLEGATLELFHRVRTCGKQLELDLSWKNTGGVCDGNKLQAFGLPTIDTLGVRGGGLHTDEEFVIVDSLVERSQLALLVLLSLASE